MHVPFRSIFSTQNMDCTSRERETHKVCPVFGSLGTKTAFSKKLLNFTLNLWRYNREVLPHSNVLNMIGQILPISNLFDTGIK